MTRADKIAELDRLLSDEVLDDMLAMARNAKEGKPVFDTLPAEHQERILAARDRAKRGEGVHSLEVVRSETDALLKSYGV